MSAPITGSGEHLAIARSRVAQSERAYVDHVKHEADCRDALRRASLARERAAQTLLEDWAAELLAHEAWRVAQDAARAAELQRRAALIPTPSQAPAPAPDQAT